MGRKRLIALAGLAGMGLLVRVKFAARVLCERALVLGLLSMGGRIAACGVELSEQVCVALMASAAIHDVLERRAECRDGLAPVLWGHRVSSQYAQQALARVRQRREIVLAGALGRAALEPERGRERLAAGEAAQARGEHPPRLARALLAAVPPAVEHAPRGRREVLELVVPLGRERADQRYLRADVLCSGVRGAREDHLKPGQLGDQPVDRARPRTPRQLDRRLAEAGVRALKLCDSLCALDDQGREDIAQHRRLACPGRAVDGDQPSERVTKARAVGDRVDRELLAEVRLSGGRTWPTSGWDQLRL
jgi:hypothetical protein